VWNGVDGCGITYLGILSFGFSGNWYLIDSLNLTDLNTLKLIFVTFLSTLILFSTTGIRISQHWCGADLINFSIWGDAEPCAHYLNEKAPACPMHANMTSKNCCSQKEVYVKGGDEDFQMESAQVFRTPYVLIQKLTAPLIIFTSRVLTVEHFRNHSPPILTESIFIRVQSLLI